MLYSFILTRKIRKNKGFSDTEKSDDFFSFYIGLKKNYIKLILVHSFIKKTILVNFFIMIILPSYDDQYFNYNNLHGNQ